MFIMQLKSVPIKTHTEETSPTLKEALDRVVGKGTQEVYGNPATQLVIGNIRSALLSSKRFDMKTLGAAENMNMARIDKPDKNGIYVAHIHADVALKPTWRQETFLENSVDITSSVKFKYNPNGTLTITTLEQTPETKSLMNKEMKDMWQKKSK